MRPGDKMTWLCTPRGGYGYTYPVDAVVLKVGPKRVQIEVRRETGELVTRSVAAANLRPRK